VLFTVVAVVVVVVILRTARRLHSIWWAVALGALLGGALGNLTDRLLRTPGFPSGHVVDFIAVKYFAVFNCADMAIVGSAILMVVLSLLGVDFARRRGEAVGDPPGGSPDSPGRDDGADDG
jgi:signal peptidase II